MAFLLILQQHIMLSLCRLVYPISAGWLFGISYCQLYLPYWSIMSFSNGMFQQVKKSGSKCWSHSIVNPNLHAAFLDSLQLQTQQQLFWTCMIHTTSQQSIIHSTNSGILRPTSNAIQLCHHRQNNIPPTLSLYISDTDIAMIYSMLLMVFYR